MSGASSKGPPTSPGGTSRFSRMRAMRTISSFHAARGRTSGGGRRWQVPQSVRAVSSSLRADPAERVMTSAAAARKTIRRRGADSSRASARNARCTMHNVDDEAYGYGLASLFLHRGTGRRSRPARASESGRTYRLPVHSCILHVHSAFVHSCIVHSPTVPYPEWPSACVHPGSSAKNISPVHPSSRMPISDE